MRASCSCSEAAFATLRADLEAARADVLIVIANDQFVNFFWNNIPTFSVRIADEVKGQSSGLKRRGDARR